MVYPFRENALIMELLTEFAVQASTFDFNGYEDRVK
jgi:hypothetical protein